MASFLWIFWPFSAHFSFGQAHFFLGFLGCKVFYLYSVFLHFWPKKWAFAHFFLKSGHAETVGIKGFAGFLVKSPLFFVNFLKNEKY